MVGSQGGVNIPSTALIVDDEKHIRVFVRLLLGQLGVQTCFEAENISEALTALATNRPGLVMLDINMPGGSGLELLRRIRAIDEEVLVIVLSAEAMSSTVMATSRAGADGFIRKDLPRERMMAELTEILASAQEE